MRFDKRILVYDIETTGLNPWDSCIICIGVWDSKHEEGKVIWEDSEEETVRKFVKYVRRNGFDEVVGFNVSFDNRFVMAKCLEYEIPVGFFFDDCYHVDLMNELQNPVSMYSSNCSGSLDDWVEYLFGREKLEDNGGVTELFEQEKFDRIESYCEDDVIITKKIFQRMRSVGLV